MMAETQIPMVNQGGESTMLGQWRIVLRQAEEAARCGRFEEAYALAGRPEVADHHQAVQLRSRLGLDLIARSARRGAADDTAGAIEDLHTAERLGAPPDSLAAARLGLADRAVDEIRASLDAGEPSQALERIEDLARNKISGPSLRRCREIAEAWQAATAEARRGEFGQAHEHLDRAERLAAGAGVNAAQDAIAAARPDLETRQKAAAPKVEALYTALAAGEWPRILAAAEAVVAVIPEHPAAKQARARAWQQIAAIDPTSSSNWVNRSPRAGRPVKTATDSEQAGDRRDEPPPAHAQAPGDAGRPRIFPAFRAALRPAQPPVDRPLARAEAGGPKGRFLLWADAVGGFLVCLDDRIILGRAGPDSQADVPLMGDLSRNHAAIVRSNESYLIEPRHPSYVNGKVVTEPTVLRDGDVIRLGPTVELEFRQPSPVSATARLAIVSRHRLPIAVDGVLLMAETCIVGAESQAHIAAPAMKDSVVLYRQGPSLWCRARGSFEVDGRTCAARAPLTLNSSVLGDGFSFSLEPLAANPV